MMTATAVCWAVIAVLSVVAAWRHVQSHGHAHRGPRRPVRRARHRLDAD